MSTEGKQPTRTSRRRFLGCAAGMLGVAAAPVREAPEEVIPLSTMYATSGQRGLLEVPVERVLDGDERKQRRLFASREIGPSNLFLVVGEDMETAVEATYAVFVDGRSVDRPARPPGAKQKARESLWVFVYLGRAQSSPTEWVVTRVAIQGDRVRVTISRPDPKKVQYVLCDSIVYMLWAPLGNREAKGLSLEVFDEPNRETMMTRRVAVVEV